MDNKNKRIIPTSNDFMKDKELNYQLYLKIQLESNWRNIDIHRYINKTKINYSVWSKELNISANTLRKNIKYLIKIGVLKEYRNDEDIEYYKICGRYDRYILLGIDEITKLINISNQHKHIIKIFILYYKYSIKYGKCRLEQREILKQIGLCPNGNNRLMLTKVNGVLQREGLIEIEKLSKYIDGNTKTMLSISSKVS